MLINEHKVHCRVAVCVDAQGAECSMRLRRHVVSVAQAGCREEILNISFERFNCVGHSQVHAAQEDWAKGGSVYSESTHRRQQLGWWSAQAAPDSDRAGCPPASGCAEPGSRLWRYGTVSTFAAHTIGRPCRPALSRQYITWPPGPGKSRLGCTGATWTDAP